MYAGKSVYYEIWIGGPVFWPQVVVAHLDRRILDLGLLEINPKDLQPLKRVQRATQRNAKARVSWVDCIFITGNSALFWNSCRFQSGHFSVLMCPQDQLWGSVSLCQTRSSQRRFISLRDLWCASLQVQQTMILGAPATVSSVLYEVDAVACYEKRTADYTVIGWWSSTIKCLDFFVIRREYLI